MAHACNEALRGPRLPLDVLPPLLEKPARESRSQLLSAATTAIMPAVGMRAERGATACERLLSKARVACTRLGLISETAVR